MRRRDSIKAIGAGLLGSAFVRPATAQAAETGGAAKSPEVASADDCGPDTDDTSEAPWWLLAPLEVNSPVKNGWRIESLSHLERGAAVVVLGDGSGLRAKVHICRKEGDGIGVATSRFFDLILVNGGNGKSATNEQVAETLVELAKRLEANENLALAKDPRALEGFLTHRARVEKFGAEVLL